MHFSTFPISACDKDTKFFGSRNKKFAFKREIVIFVSKLIAKDDDKTVGPDVFLYDKNKILVHIQKQTPNGASGPLETRDGKFAPKSQTFLLRH